MFIIQKVQALVIHLKVDEEQWEITPGSKRQAKCVWSPRAMPDLRLLDTPHAQKGSHDPRLYTGNKIKEKYLLVKGWHACEMPRTN